MSKFVRVMRYDRSLALHRNITTRAREEQKQRESLAAMSSSPPRAGTVGTADAVSSSQLSCTNAKQQVSKSSGGR